MEDQEQRTGIEAPAHGECFCHLLKGHPHASLNEMCSTCRRDYEVWSVQQDQAAALAVFDQQWAHAGKAEAAWDRVIADVVALEVN